LDNNYLKPFIVLFNSLLKTNSIPTGVRIFIIHDEKFNLSTAILELNQFESICQFNLEFIDVTSKLPVELPKLVSEHISIATFYRLFVSNIIPIEIKSIVYLDSDLLCVQDISELFKLEISNPIAAVDHFSPADELRLHGNFGGKYFQAGVLIIDLNYWRNNNIESIFLQIIADENSRILWWDQDILNIAFKENWSPLEIGYNSTQSIVLSKSKWYQSENLNIKVIHFDGGLKPWATIQKLPFHDEWNNSFLELYGKEYFQFRKAKLLLFSILKKLYHFNLKQLVDLLFRK
jgi:lipopolysaccharide biosynthesis glycosyltransferase